MSSAQENLEVVLNNLKSKPDKKETKPVVISKETTKRLIKDIRDVVRHPLNDNGIYYIHDELDMMKGYAMIIGPADTIYQHGFYFLNLLFQQIILTVLRELFTILTMERPDFIRICIEMVRFVCLFSTRGAENNGHLVKHYVQFY